MRNNFVSNLLKEMLDNKDNDAHFKEMFRMIEDILHHLERREGEECKMN